MRNRLIDALPGDIRRELDPRIVIASASTESRSAPAASSNCMVALSALKPG